MRRPIKGRRAWGVVAVALAAFALGACQQIHDPWVQPAGSMQAERNVGIPQQQQLEVRQLYGQSDR